MVLHLQSKSKESIRTELVDRLICPISPKAIDFSRPVVTRLIEDLESNPLPNLSPNEQAHLIVLIQATLEVCHFNFKDFVINKSQFDGIDSRTTSCT